MRRSHNNKPRSFLKSVTHLSWDQLCSDTWTAASRSPHVTGSHRHTVHIQLILKGSKSEDPLEQRQKYTLKFENTDVTERLLLVMFPPSEQRCRSRAGSPCNWGLEHKKKRLVCAIQPSPTTEQKSFAVDLK